MMYLSTFTIARLFALLTVTPSHDLHKNGAANGLNIAPINKVTYSSTGGRGGNTVRLEITANMVTYVQGRGGTEKTVTEKTSKSLWQSLIRAINLQDVDAVKSSPGHALYDGIDVTITVVKGKDVHSIVNGSDDSANYKKIKGFTNILEGQLGRLEKRIRW